MRRRIDDFRPYTAKQIAFLNRGKGIDVPDVQSAIEEVKSMMDEIDHLHRGEGEDSIQLGPNSKASADYSIAFGSSAYTDNEARRAIALGASSRANRESSVAIGDGAYANAESGIAIGKNANTSSSQGGDTDSIAIGTSALSANQSTAIGTRAWATRSHTVAIGVNSQSNNEHAISIGTEAQANSPNNISIGRRSQTSSENAVALGYGASASAQNTIAIGPNSLSSGPGGIAVGDEANAATEGCIAIGSQAKTGSWEGGNIAIGQGAIAYFERSIAIGSGAEARANNAVAIGPGAIANEINTIVIGTPDHVVIIPGELRVLGLKSIITWIAPSDDVIQEISSPIHANDGITQRTLILRNPGRYRIKGEIYADVNSWAKLDILENGEPIVEPVFVSESSTTFSLDFTRDIGVNTTLTFRLEVDRISSDDPIPSAGRVGPIQICGTKADIGSGVIGW